MRPADLLRFNLRLLTGQWFRSLMSLLATAVGVAAVLLLTGLGEGRASLCWMSSICWARMC